MSLRIALAPFLMNCAPLITLGIRPCMSDYSPREKELLRNADRIFFPTPLYVDVLEAASKLTFPSAASYRYARSRVLQALLFQQPGWPAARTRLYFGRRQKSRIVDDFPMPFDALSPDPRHRTSHRIRSVGDLEAVLDTHNPLVIREIVPWEDRLRLISVHYECIAVQRIGGDEGSGREFPPVALSDRDLDVLLTMNRDFTRMAMLDDIAVDWGLHMGQWRLVEMTPPPLHIRTCGHSIRRHEIIRDLIVGGVL